MAFCSNFRVTHGGTVLLDFDDKIDAPPSLDGSQEVQITPYLRAESVGVFARGNQQHTLEWTQSEAVSNVNTTTINVFDWPLDLPRGAATTVITISGSNTSYYLSDSVVESWGSSWDNQRESKTISIVGGEWLVSVSQYTSDNTTITADSTILTADIQ